MDKKSMVFIVAVLTAAFLTGANTNGVPDEIKVKSFVVVDDDGKVMLVLKSDKNGGGLSVYDKNEKVLAAIIGSESGGHIIVYGKDEKVSTSIRGDKHGGILAVYNKDKQRAAVMEVATKAAG